MSAESIKSKKIFQKIEKQRISSDFNNIVGRQNPVYQISKLHPGLIEQILPDGSVLTGKFRNG